MTSRFEGRVAVVTGSASGIGAATARRLVQEGCTVLVADVQDEAGTRLADELGGRARFVHCDVASEPDIAAVVDDAVERHGRLDLFHANAGVMGALGPIATSVTEDVDATIAINLRGALLSMKHAARVMRPQGSGVILATSSPAGQVGGVGAHTYSATKAGIIGLVQSVAAELRPYGIRVNVVVPGAVVSAMTADILTGDAADTAAARQALEGGTIRPGLPEDVAAVAVFLASDDAAFVTGSTFHADGGYTRAPGDSPFAQGAWTTPTGMFEAGRRTRG
jgi:NAD(P)-dependent dehydrogenase (short-subunit alcohol dehydrogenase family)